MKAPSIPSNEDQRLAALQQLNVLDTLPEERFDRITRLATQLFDVPIALVSLVDANRQWFKSRQGCDWTETSREVSFCGHAVYHEEPLIIPDTLNDERFYDNPLVSGDTNIRFYAGYPIFALDGSCVGTLCLIDHKPRDYTEADFNNHQDLAAITESELNFELFFALQQQLAQQNQELHEILDAVEAQMG